MPRWRLVLDFLYPPRCPACQVRTGALGFCDRCRTQIRPVGSPMCPVCGLPFEGRGADHLCKNCYRHQPRFRRARARMVFTSRDRNPVIEVLARCKYGRDVTVAAALASLLIEAAPLPLDHDVIVPVPLHRDRLRWRGFNQAVPLARALGRLGGQPVDPFVLTRRHATPPQVGLGAADRRRNVRGAFSVRHTDRVRGRSVLLVDDVMTTGATAHECARALCSAGARHVDAVVLARALDIA